MQKRTGVSFYDDPNTKKLLDWYVRFSSPLVRFPGMTAENPAGQPTLPVWGDSNYGDYFQACAMFAPHYVASDPDFSKRLMWMWQRTGSPYQTGWDFDLLFPMLIDPGLPDAPQVLGSDLSKKMGYVLLRSGFDTPGETAIYMRGGQTGIDHQRADLGSIDLFSQGIPLALGSESGPYSLVKEDEWNRSQLSNNDVVFGDTPQDRLESSGKIDAFFTSPLVDYSVADCSRPTSKDVPAAQSFHWRRHLLLAKQPDYLVVWDEISSTMPAKWYLHTTADHFVWQKHLVTSETAYNADLDIHVLSPADPLVPDEQVGRMGEHSLKDPLRPGHIMDREDPYPFDALKYLSIAARPNEDFVTVLHPRMPRGEPLQATLVSSSKDKIELLVKLGETADRIIMKVDGASFQRGGTPAINMPMEIVDP